MRTFLALLFVASAVLPMSVVSAWIGPTQSPPAGNVAAPINVGTTAQVKNGGLGVNTLTVFGNSLFGGSTGSNAYLNFGATGGTNGYGIRDNAGLLEFKNSGGSWSSLQSTIFNLVGGAGSWTASGNDIHNNNTGNVGIGTTNPSERLDMGTSNIKAGYEIRSTACGGAQYCSVSCSGAKYAIGGGCSMDDTFSSPKTIIRSYPTNTSWNCVSSISVNVLTSYVICLQVR